MSLFTGKGDDGTTKTLDSGGRISKSSNIAEALGSLDEINSFLGLCKVKSQENRYQISNISFEEIVHRLQKNLFITQAELAGAEKTVSEDKVKEIEGWKKDMESKMPPIKSFFISGGTELAATFDVARTIARRAERRVKAVVEEGKEVGEYTKKFLNRLSSVLYALARYSNFLAGITEEAPDYK
jgi:cob(I)alamin adenosyltransferase